MSARPWWGLATAAVLTAAAVPIGASASCGPEACPPLALVGTSLVDHCSDAEGEAPCVHRTDPVWDAVGDGGEHAQGLTWPGFGPPVLHGGFSMNTTVAPGSCVGPNGSCAVEISGSIHPIDGGVGAYCGATRYVGEILMTWSDGTVLSGTVSWDAAPLGRPLTGVVINSDPAGYEGRQILGRITARGAGDGGDCGVTAPTTRMMAEMTIFVG